MIGRRLALRSLLGAVWLVAAGAWGGVLDCGYQHTDVLYVASSRDDAHPVHSEAAFVILGNDASSACANVDFAVIPTGAPNYESVYSALLAAKLADRPIRIVVRDYAIPGAPKNHRIDWVNIQ